MHYVVAFCVSAFFPLSYVGLLHVVDKNGTNRNDRSSVKKRFVAAVINNVLAVFITFIILWKESESPLAEMGFRRHNLVKSIVIPCFLVNLLYLGQWVLLYFEKQLNYEGVKYWFSSFNDICWIRDCFMAPITEEIAFRSCSVTIMALSFSHSWTILVAPLFFALSHFHHVGDDRRRGIPLEKAIAGRAFQFLYTYVFGIYVTYLFLSTRNIASAIVTHAMCNSLGLPAIGEIDNFTNDKHRTILWLSFIIGIVSFFLLLLPLTNPLLYS